MLGSQEKILEPKVNVNFFTVDPRMEEDKKHQTLCRICTDIKA